METLQIQIINPKAKKILDDLELIAIKEYELFPLIKEQRKSIAAGKKQIRKGEYKTHNQAMAELTNG